MTPILQVRALEKAFGDADSRIEVIRKLDLEMDKGAFEAVMGPSGSGKSTLLHLLAGLIPADAGDILIDGTSICGRSDSDMTIFRRRHIGLIFQDFNLIPTLTAEENVALPMLLDHRRPDSAHIAHVMEMLGIAARRDHLPGKLSGGERQRVAIARALANNPPVILADEPTGNLDTATSVQIMNLLTELNARGRTILMVTHEEDVAAFAKSRIVLRDGRIVKREGTVLE